MTAVLALAALVLLGASAQAQTFQVLHNFTGGADGDAPYAGVTLDQQGRIYGTTSMAAATDNGVVYRLVREGEGWVFADLQLRFPGKADGAAPYPG